MIVGSISWKWEIKLKAKKCLNLNLGLVGPHKFNKQRQEWSVLTLGSRRLL